MATPTLIKAVFLLAAGIFAVVGLAAGPANADRANYANLTDLQYKVMKKNGTEPPFDNEYWDNKKPSIYVDRLSGEPLFSSEDKFVSGTGWPSFTRPLRGDAVTEHQDRSYGMVRTEIRSPSSDSHLGHVFPHHTATGVRYCMNSAAMRFIPAEELAAQGYPDLARRFPDVAQKESTTQVASFAAGCFWGIEETFRTTPGVLDTEVGYAGGHTNNPTYTEVCSGTTGHAETVRVVYDPSEISYDKLLEIFWDNHDPTQVNRQGPDIGTQYRSAIFAHTPEQRAAAEKSKQQLGASGRFDRSIATQIADAPKFYAAEEYHQEYIRKNGKGWCAW